MTELIILTGYLGSGKTTTLKHVLSHLPESVKTAVIINEYAAAGIDGKIIDNKKYTVRELENGCICCTRGRDLKQQIQHLKQLHAPDVILIETTGVAEPEPLLDIIEETNTPVKSVVTVVDAYQYEKTRKLGDVSQRQIKLSSLVIINKQDLVSEKVLKELKDLVHSLNDHTHVCSTEHGQLSTATLLNAPTPQLVKRKKARRVHRHETSSVTLHTKKIVRLQDLEELLSSLPHDVARAKGIVRTSHGYRLFQYAAGLYTIEPAQKPADSIGVLVFIGPLRMSTRLSLLKKVHSATQGSGKELFANTKQIFKSLD